LGNIIAGVGLDVIKVGEILAKPAFAFGFTPCQVADAACILKARDHYLF